MSKQDGALVAQRVVNDLPFLVADGRPGPFGKIGAVVVEHRRVHVGGDQRLADHRQRRAVWRMGVHDRVHVRPMAVNPQMEAIRRVHHAVAFEQLEIVVDQHDIAGARLVEAETEAQHPVGAGLVAARGDLAGERGLMALVGENPAGESNLLAQRPGRQIQMALHLLGGARVVLGFVTDDHIAHVSVSPVIRASRRPGVPARPISGSRPRHRRPAPSGCCRPPPRLARAAGRRRPVT